MLVSCVAGGQVVWPGESDARVADGVCSGREWHGFITCLSCPRAAQKAPLRAMFLPVEEAGWKAQDYLATGDHQRLREVGRVAPEQAALQSCPGFCIAARASIKQAV